MYNSELLDRSLHPLYRGELQGADIVEELFNYSCGDQLKIYLKIKDSIIIDGRHSGYACAIASVSADLMIENFINQPITKIPEIKQAFLAHISPTQNLTNSSRPDVSISSSSLHLLSDVSRMPARINCAKLPWEICDVDFSKTI